MTDTPDDHALLPKLRARDPDAFAALFELYADKLFRLALGIVKDEAEAEGVVQEAFMRLFESLDDFEGRSRLGTWLYRVTYNAAIDRVRRARPGVRLADEFAGDEEDGLPAPVILADWRDAPEAALDSAETQTALDEAINRLSPSLRTVFILREIDGLSTAETARVLSISESAAKVRLHRARLQLRETLSGHFSHAPAGRR